METYTSVDGKVKIQSPIRPEGLTDSGTKPYWMVDKQTVIDIEKTNQRSIIVYHRYGKWWQMGGNSLLFYLHHLQKSHDLRVLKAVGDKDFHPRWDNNPGCASISDITVLSTEMQAKAHARLYIETPHLLVFRLNKGYDKAAVETFRNIKVEREKRANSVLMPKVIAPVLKQHCEELTRLVVNKVMNLATGKRELILHDGVDVCNYLSMGCILMCRGAIKKEKFFSEALEKIDILEAWLLYARIFNVYTIDEEERIIEQILIIQRELNDGK